MSGFASAPVKFQMVYVMGESMPKWMLESSTGMASGISCCEAPEGAEQLYPSTGTPQPLADGDQVQLVGGITGDATQCIWDGAVSDPGLGKKTGSEGDLVKLRRFLQLYRQAKRMGR